MTEQEIVLLSMKCWLLPHLKLPPAHFPSPYPSTRIFRSDAPFRCCVPQIRINQSSFTAVSQSVDGVMGVVQSKGGGKESSGGREDRLQLDPEDLNKKGCEW